jgi:hypothetical protein
LRIVFQGGVVARQFALNLLDAGQAGTTRVIVQAPLAQFTPLARQWAEVIVQQAVGQSKPDQNFPDLDAIFNSLFNMYFRAFLSVAAKFFASKIKTRSKFSHLGPERDIARAGMGRVGGSDQSCFQCLPDHD